MENKKLSRKELETLMAELYELTTVKREEIMKKLAEAREYGDLCNNPMYDTVKEEQRAMETRIAELKRIIEDALENEKQ